jgi:hypothetical protein
LTRPKATTRLSQLVIDADKDWQGQGLVNVKEVTAGMARGDIVFYGDGGLDRLSPGPIGSMLTTHDFGNEPSWSYAP